MTTRIDHIAGGIHRISTWSPEAGITFNQFLIVDERPRARPHRNVRAVLDGPPGDRRVLRHTLRFLETPHVHHWDSMMVVEESTGSLFPSDRFLQPGDQPPVTGENIAHEMVEAYRSYGIFAHEDPVRAVADRIETLSPDWIHAMHGATLPGDALPHYISALRENEFAYRGLLLGRAVNPRSHRQ